MLATQNQQLKDFIAKGRVDKALEDLAVYTQSLADPHYHNSLTQLSARWRTNERANNMGTLSGGEYNTERNKINKAVLDLMDELTNSTPPSGLPRQPSGPEQPQAVSGESGLWKRLGYVAIIAGILGGFAEFFNFINIFPNSSGDSMQLTVYVQDAAGKPIPALQNTGHVIVRFDNDLRDPVIGENGRTNLGEIPTKFRGQDIEVVLVAEGYEPVLSGQKYKMDGKPIYLNVRPDNSLGTIQGIVKDRSGEKFIEGALVMIDQETTLTTDNLGRFKVVLPLEKQRTTYTITVKKDGYKVKSEYFKPKTGAMEVRLDR